MRVAVSAWRRLVFEARYERFIVVRRGRAEMSCDSRMTARRLSALRHVRRSHVVPATLTPGVRALADWTLSYPVSDDEGRPATVERPCPRRTRPGLGVADPESPELGVECAPFYGAQYHALYR